MIAVINLGLGNLYSVSRALQYLGADFVITDQPKEISNARKIIIPGVGSYAAGMESIVRNELEDTIKDFALNGRPVMGICLGMQLLMDYSKENGHHKGLGLVSGKVEYFQDMPGFDLSTKVPNVNWCSIKRDCKSWNESILDGIPQRSDCYFVHSLCVVPDDLDNILALSSYGGVQFASVIHKENIFGCQFHPEKSSEIGLDIVRNFLNLG